MVLGIIDANTQPKKIHYFVSSTGATVRYKKKLPTKSPRVAVTAAPPSAGDQSLGSVSRSTCSQQRLQNEDTASPSASARTVAIAIADGDLSEKSNEDECWF
jgi:hypothetical protein